MDSFTKPFIYKGLEVNDLPRVSNGVYIHEQNHLVRMTAVSERSLPRNAPCVHQERPEMSSTWTPNWLPTPMKALSLLR